MRYEVKIMTTPLKSNPIFFVGDISRYVLRTEGDEIRLDITMLVHGATKEQMALSVEQWDNVQMSIKPGDTARYNRIKAIAEAKK
jgi:hypothetical protein